MATHMLRLLALIALTAVCVSTAHSQNNSPVEKREQLAGCWRGISLSDEVKKKFNEIDIGAAAFEWFCFGANGTMNIMASSTARSVTVKDLNEAFAVLTPDITYEVVQPGVVRTVQRTTGQTLVWATSFKGDASVLFDGTSVPKGALIMGLFDFNKKRPVYWRYMSRMQDGQ